MKTGYYVPKSPIHSELEVWPWYKNIKSELEENFLSPVEKKALGDYYKKAGLLTLWKRPFFRKHFSETTFRSINFIFSTSQAPRILDLGCGTGSQAILFALLGASVVGLDADKQALSILEKRKSFYEDISGVKLNLAMHEANCFNFDFNQIPPFDVLHSVFAFNMMQPSMLLLNKVLPNLSPEGKVCILDGNNVSWLARYWPGRWRDTLGPVKFASELRQRGFCIDRHHGGVAIPPPLWLFAPFGRLSAIDDHMSKTWFFALSHHIHAQKEPKKGP